MINKNSTINLLYRIFLRLKSGYYRKKYKIIGGKNLKIKGKTRIHRGKNGVIEIGDNCTIESHIYGASTIIITNSGKLKIGNYGGISSALIIATNYVEIGNHCLIGLHSTIIDSDFHSIAPQIRVNELIGKFHNQPLLINEDNTAQKEIIIEDNVWIGANAIILKGVRIGKNSVIGAGSVVTKDVPPNVIAAGNPAKIVKGIT